MFGYTDHQIKLNKLHKQLALSIRSAPQTGKLKGAKQTSTGQLRSEALVPGVRGLYGLPPGGGTAVS